MNTSIINKIQLKLLKKAIRDYNSGDNLRVISRRYGLKSKHIISLSEKYQEDELIVFQRRDSKPISKSMELEIERKRIMELQESKIRFLEAKIKELNRTIKLARKKQLVMNNP